MALSASVAVILLSLTAIPITYIVNTAQSLHGEQGLLWSGVGSLSTLLLITYFVINRQGAPRDPLYYVLMLCTFGGVASLILALEADGIIKGLVSKYLAEGEPYLQTSHGIMISYWDGIVFMLGTFSSAVDFLIGLENDGLLFGFVTNYLRDGEPYLQTAHGSMICYWDGIAHYVMYILMLGALSWGRSYREVGLYWAGSIGHSMIVFIPGNVVGKFGLRASFLLNVPYMFLPFWSMARFLRERPKHCVHKKLAVRRIWCRPLDMLLVLCLILAIVVAFLRGFAALGAPNDLFRIYREEFEPYLNDPVSYPKIQMLVYMFYYVPYYVLAIYGLVYPGNAWMPDWSLIHAGAAAQAQVSHIGASLHTSTEQRVPSDPVIRSTFWLINVALLLVVPQLLALRCNVTKSFFAHPTDSGEKLQTKSSKQKKND